MTMMAETPKHETRAPAEKGPVRTCAGCSKRGTADELVRVVLDETPDSASVVVDFRGGQLGRGAHVHPTPDCIAKAEKTGFSRVFKRSVTVTTSLSMQIREAAARRIDGLLSGARRARHVAFGADAVEDMLAKGEASLVVVACDAAAAATGAEVRDAIDQGKAIAYGDKASLGAIFDKSEVGVVAVLDEGLASAIFRTYRTAEQACARTPGQWGATANPSRGVKHGGLGRIDE